MKNKFEMLDLDEMTNCKRCGASVNILAVFPGKLCVACHEKKFNASVKANNGILPRPDFLSAIAK